MQRAVRIERKNRALLHRQFIGIIPRPPGDIGQHIHAPLVLEGEQEGVAPVRPGFRVVYQFPALGGSFQGFIAISQVSLSSRVRRLGEHPVIIGTSHHEQQACNP